MNIKNDISVDIIHRFTHRLVWGKSLLCFTSNAGIASRTLRYFYMKQHVCFDVTHSINHIIFLTHSIDLNGLQSAWFFGCCFLPKNCFKVNLTLAWFVKIIFEAQFDLHLIFQGHPEHGM